MIIFGGGFGDRVWHWMLEVRCPPPISRNVAGRVDEKIPFGRGNTRPLKGRNTAARPLWRCPPPLPMPFGTASPQVTIEPLPGVFWLSAASHPLYASHSKVPQASHSSIPQVHSCLCPSMGDDKPQHSFFF